jgi:hypothetical protein
LPCGQNEHVINGECTPCPPGTRNEGDTTCEPITCNANENVQNNVCTPCPEGTVRDAGDLATERDTTCESTTCGENQRVQDNECTDCPDNTYSSPGHNRLGPNTHCIIGDGICGQWNIIATGGLNPSSPPSGASDTPDLSESHLIRKCPFNNENCMTIDGNGERLQVGGRDNPVELTCNNYENFYEKIVIPQTTIMINSSQANDPNNDPISEDELTEFTREIIEELTNCKNNVMSICMNDRNGRCVTSNDEIRAFETVDCSTILTFGECTGLTGSGSGNSPYDILVNPENPSPSGTVGEMVQRLNCRRNDPTEQKQCIELNNTLDQCNWIPD